MKVLCDHRSVVYSSDFKDQAMASMTEEEVKHVRDVVRVVVVTQSVVQVVAWLGSNLSEESKKKLRENDDTLIQKLKDSGFNSAERVLKSMNRYDTPGLWKQDRTLIRAPEPAFADSMTEDDIEDAWDILHPPGTLGSARLCSAMLCVLLFC